ncbi:histone deacetylase family protein [Hwanghaeella sp.]|uniref:histone deacetylase family protein n=1 Tax=Hwanghaeella sp. TaxID=2605943 RepID=UPI003CCBD851
MKTVFTERHRLRNSQTELYGGTLVRPFECPERMDFITGELNKRGLGDFVEPKEYGMDPVLAVHDAGFVDFLSKAWKIWIDSGYEGEAITTVWPARSYRSDKIPNHIDGLLGYYALASETSISEGTWEAALASKDVALTAADIVLADKGAAFALCRPPGHHAATSQFGGYCFLNNAAIAANHMRGKGAARVAILDVDFHHGNGTQEIFYGRDDVLFVSLHGDPMDAFPHFLGYADETGSGAGEGYTANFPLPRGADYGVWGAALDEGLRRIADFRADALVVSLGVDTFEKDPISFFKLRSQDFTDYGKRIAGADLPTLFVMEGGYAVEEIGINTVNVLDGFMSAASRAKA